MFELYSNARIFIRMLKECVFNTCSWKMPSSEDEKKHETGKRILYFYSYPFCAERDVTQEGSCEQTWQSVMVRGRWVKKAILGWYNYWITPK